MSNPRSEDELQASLRLKTQLIQHEDDRQFPYMDCCGKSFRLCTCSPNGKLTIGVGRNLEDVGLSKTERQFLLDNDIARANAAVLARIDVSHRLDSVRRAVLFNMCFNLGIGGLLQFVRFLKALEMGDWFQARLEMLDSKWARQVGERAQELSEQMLTGKWRTDDDLD